MNQLPSIALKMTAIVLLLQLAAFAAEPTKPATAPTTAPVVLVQPDGSLLLKAEGARIHGFHMRLGGKEEPILFFWTDREEYPEWPQAVAKKGTYAVELTYSCAPKAGGDFAVFAAANKAAGTTIPTADWQTFQTVKLGNLTVLNDDTSIALRCTGRFDRALMCVRSIKLTPVPEPDKKK